MPTLTAPGIGSNLDVTGLVTKLMTVERQPVQKLDAKEAATQVQISAYGNLKGALSQFHSAVQTMTDPTRFFAVRSNIGDSSVASVSATNAAAPGNYSLEVSQLATLQKLNSTTFADKNTTVGSGTITIAYGTYDSGANTFTANGAQPAQTLIIDSAHSSLAGVRDAINAGNLGVSATIVNDGTGNRLVVSSKDTGADNSLRITVSDADGNNTDASGLSRLAYDPTAAGAGSGKNMAQLQAAQDAKFTLDGLLVTKDSNSVTDAIDGVTLNLLAKNVGSPTTLTVTQDTGAVQSALSSLVTAYNTLNSTLSDLSKSDPATQQVGALAGDAVLRQIVTQLRTAMTSPVAGISGKYAALPQIGLSFDRNGVLTLDATKLQSALHSDPSAVQKLLTQSGSASDPLVQYVGGSAHTQPGSYAVSVSQLATQGASSGASAAGLSIDTTNDTLSLSVDGVSTSVALQQSVYANADALASELQSKINGASALSSAGVTVRVTQNAGVLSITSDRYGAQSSVVVHAGAGATNLFGGSPVEAAGVDALGTLASASTTSVGQQLTGGSSGSAAGLQVKITGGALGARGQVTFSRGVAAQLDALLNQLEATKNPIASRIDMLQRTVVAIGKDRDALNTRLDGVEKRYTDEFTKLDEMLTQMQQTSTYLAQQLASLPAITTK
jgi:flagellar hook-associated protein 2